MIDMDFIMVGESIDGKLLDVVVIDFLDFNVDELVGLLVIMVLFELCVLVN